MQCKIEVNGSTEIFDIDKVAKQAAGAALLRVKNTVVLATVAREETQVQEDFLPLTVQYIEKMYAAGRIPGGYIKRETKPGDFEPLTSRIIDRSLRPLFPKGYAYPTQIVVYVLSADPEVDLQVVALNAASAALYLSDIPIKAPVCGVRIGYENGNFILNPSNSALKASALDLYVAGVGDELLMIEMRSIPQINGGAQQMNEFGEDLMVDAIDFAARAISAGSGAYEEAFLPLKKPDASLEYKPEIEDEDIADFIDANYKDAVKAAINQMAKSERATELNKIVDQILTTEAAAQNEWSKEVISSVIGKYKRGIIRTQIIEDHRRADGRAQLSDSLTQLEPISDRFMFNYNFPGFCVGEASPLKSPGRRELGHGNLAKRALYPSIDLNSPQSIRVVSEILESNGSSSMASVCGGALSLRAAGVPTLKLVAGVAMGLIFEGEKHAVLTDIMGLEDHDGDMDFKVAGTYEGITALQMDIKLGGISLEVLKEALAQAKQARAHILGLMEQADAAIVINEDVLPKLEIFSVEASKIPDIIGQGGKVIKEITESFGVSIDLDREKGEVKIQGAKASGVSGAKEKILSIVSNSRDFRKPRGERKEVKFQIGEEFDGVVQSVLDFGTFISLRDGVDGLLRAKFITTPYKAGDVVRVRVTDQKGTKISLELA